MFKGEQVPSYSLATVSNDKLSKVLKKKAQVVVMQCWSLKVECFAADMQNDNPSDREKEIPRALQEVIADFEDVFAVPNGLPPCRSHDHKIVMKEGTQAVNCRPYRYGPVQKDIIENMVQEMMESGVIQNSTSSFSSPMVLVKKKTILGVCV